MIKISRKNWLSQTMRNQMTIQHC